MYSDFFIYIIYNIGKKVLDLQKPNVQREQLFRSSLHVYKCYIK